MLSFRGLFMQTYLIFYEEIVTMSKNDASHRNRKDGGIMKKWISVMLCLALVAGMLTIDTNATASEGAEKKEQVTTEMSGGSGQASWVTPSPETATVESGSVATAAPTITPTTTPMPTQTPVFAGNLTVNAEDVFVTADGTEEGTCIITGYTGDVAATTIYVPAKLNEKTVTAVSGAVFANCYFLKNLVVKGDTEIQGSGTFHPEAKVEIWGVANGKMSVFAGTAGLTFHAIDGPATVKGKRAKNFKKATLNWDAVEGAISYDISRKKGKKEYEVITNVTTTTYTDGKLKAGTKYTYKIAPVFMAANGETIVGNNSKKKAITLAPAKPQKVRAKGIRGGVQVRWKRDKSVSGYQVYMKVHVKGFKTKFNRVKTIKKNKITGYRCKMLVRGMKYSYRVRTYKKVKGKKVYSPFVKVTTKAK